MSNEPKIVTNFREALQRDKCGMPPVAVKLLQQWETTVDERNDIRKDSIHWRVTAEHQAVTICDQRETIEELRATIVKLKTQITQMSNT